MVAYGALFLWPLVAVLLFRLRPPVEAAVWTVLGGYLLLPVNTGINLPLLPSINKGIVPSAMAGLLLWLTWRGQNAPQAAYGTSTRVLVPEQVLPGLIPKSIVIRVLLAMLVIGLFMTFVTNRDVQVFGPRVLPALRFYDAISTIMQALLALIPLFVARKFLGHPETHKALLLVFVLAGLAYSLLAMYELRMSPQLNRMVYGFTAQSWLMNARGDGWRPTIFLGHGLVVGVFFAMAAVAAVASLRSRGRSGLMFSVAAAAWLCATVVLMNSLGAAIIMVMLVPVVLLLGVRLQLIAAGLFAGAILFYPLLRSADLVPIDPILDVAREIDPARAGSLSYRLLNEDLLMEKANQRPIFGWGGWARSRVFDEAGRDIGVTDGLWAIYMGVGGWVGYIARFGLMTIPILFLAFRRRGQPISLATSGLCLVLVANLIDMIPNSSISPISWFLAGALIGRLEHQRVSEAETDAEGAPKSDPDSGQNPGAPPGPNPGPRYARKPPRPVRGRSYV